MSKLQGPNWTFWAVVVGVVGVIVAIVGIWLTQSRGSAPPITVAIQGNGQASSSPPPTPTYQPKPNVTQNTTEAGNMKGAKQPDVTNPVEPPVSPVKQPNPRVEARPANNDIGKTKKNELLEVTIENAWTSTGAVRFAGCSYDVSADKKAVYVRFTKRTLSGSRKPSSQEQSDLLFIKPTDFLIIDDSGRRVDPSCGKAPFYAVSEDAHTFVYLVPRNSSRLTFTFQKAGLGEALTFDLSGLE
jgi:hypothetical protein